MSNESNESKQTPRPRCEGCGNEIDPDTCWCGDSINHNAWNAGHSPVTMGCDCRREFSEEAPTNASLDTKNAKLIAALHECEAYFADREDVVDGSYGEPAPNKEMRLLQEIRSALRASDTKETTL